MSGEGGAPAAALDPGILAEAARIGAAPPAPGPAAAAPGAAAPAAPAAPIDYRAEARELWKIIALLHFRWPSLEAVFDDATIERLADAWAPVLERHKLDLGKFTIYFVAGTATLPVLGDAYKAIRADVAERAAIGARAGAAAPEAPQPVTPAAGPPDKPNLPPDTTRIHERA